jgi:branched-chain amino acid transport system permease protein
MGERIVNVDVRRLIPRLVVGLLIGGALLYIIVIANPPPEVGGNWRTTTFGSAFDDWRSFTRTLLNGLTFAGLLFIVASGFSLIFGLMRVVNMAHGSFYLLGGYVAYEVQQKMTGSGFSIAGTDVTTWEWVFPALVAASLIGVVGLMVQQVFLRWNQGQELRQALITIAISIIIADQVIAHFNEGIPASVTWPGWTDRLVQLPLLGIDYSVARLVLLFLGLGVGLGLWLWLYRTRTGLVIRAGVDDRQMTSALGVNIQFTFAIAFVVGSALAAFGGVVGTSQGSISVGQDGQWLLNSLVVVIIGGLGSLLGAAVGSLLYGLVFSFSSVYLPTTSDNCCTQYSIVLTFVLFALVLAFRPQGLFGRLS